MTTVQAALDLAIAKAGSQSALGRAIGKTQGHVWQWKKRGRVPPLQAIEIEKRFGISRQDLCPEIFTTSQEGMENAG
mgnify:CR=1 FL=1